VNAHLLGIPALVFFTILAFMVIRSGRVSWLDVFIFVCFGYYLGGSTVGGLLNGFVSALASLVGGGR
jgi:hypothetical protein